MSPYMAEKKKPECPVLLELSTLVEYLPKEKLDSVLAEHKEHIDKVAYILHDKDTLKDGTPKSDHWHIEMRFNRGRRLSDVASWFGIAENFFAFSKTGKYDDMLAYMVHANALEKHQYDASEVHANFDYTAWLQEYKAKEKKKLTEARRKEIINLIATGVIREYNLNEFVSATEYDKYRSSIKHSQEYRTTILEQQNKRNMEVVYIYGNGGTGKSTYAEEIAKRRGYSFKRSASERDPLGSYRGQDAFVLDDVRPNTFNFQDWMGILDNHQDRAGGSRFHDKIFTECKVLFITTTDTPEEFWKELSADRPHEDPNQFYRRVKTVIHMTDEKIFCRRYDEKLKTYGQEFFLENDTYNRFELKSETEEEQKEKLASSLGIDKLLFNKEIEVEQLKGLKPIETVQNSPSPSVRIIDDGSADRFYLVAEHTTDEVKNKIKEFANHLL